MDTEERWFKLERAGLVRLVCTPDPHHSYPCVPGGCPHRVVVNGFRFVVDVEGWAESVQFDAGDIAARWRDIVTCLRTVAVDSPPEDVRGDRDKLAAWNDKHRSSMNDISAAAHVGWSLVA